MIRTFKLGVFICATGLAGCLSIDDIPLAKKPDAEEPVPSPVSTPEAGAPSSSTVNTPMAQGYPTTKCDQGNVNAPCVFWIESQHGSVTAQMQSGDYVYWLETGTTDSFKNYAYDGALVRAKLGLWQREELFTGLDLWSKSERTVHPRIELVVSDEHIFWSWYEEGVWSQHGTLPSTLHPITADLHVRRDNCVYAKPYQYCSFRFPPEVLRRNPSKGEPFLHVPYVAHASVVGATPHAVYAFRYGESELRRWALPEMVETTIPGVTRGQVLDVTSDDQLIGLLADGRIAIIAKAGPEVWRAVSNVADYLGHSGGWIYWSQKANVTHQNAVDATFTVRLGRSKLDGTKTEVVGEIAHRQGSWDAYAYSRPQLGSLGFAVTIHAEGPHPLPGFRYIPFPPN